MKRKCPLLIVLFLSFNMMHAQVPKAGKYQSLDGRYAISISVTADGSIEVKEPNKTSVYKKDGNYYRHSQPQYSAYLIKVGANSEIYTLKEGSNSEFRFNWVASEEVASESCPAYDKYTAKAKEGDGDEVQAWVFCAAAALAKCNYTDEGFRTQVAGIVANLKLIIVDKSKCPCEDVISQQIWDAN